MNNSESSFDAFPFKISELIKDLEKIKDKHGDLQIAVRSIDDETGLVKHAEGIGIWIFLKKDASFLDRADESLGDSFLSLG